MEKNEVMEKAKESVLMQLKLIEGAGKIIQKQIDAGQCPTEAIARLSEATRNLVGGYGWPFVPPMDAAEIGGTGNAEDQDAGAAAGDI